MNKKGGLIGWLWFGVVIFMIWVIFFRTERLFEVINNIKDVCRVFEPCVKLAGVIPR